MENVDHVQVCPVLASADLCGVIGKFAANESGTPVRYFVGGFALIMRRGYCTSNRVADDISTLSVLLP